MRGSELKITTAPAAVTDCNCSLCRRHGAPWACYPPEQIRIVAAGPDGADTGKYLED